MRAMTSSTGWDRGWKVALAVAPGVIAALGMIAGAMAAADPRPARAEILAAPAAQFGGGADLAISKTVSAQDVSPGAIFTFTLEVTNLGPLGANRVRVADLWPGGLTALAANVPGGACTIEPDQVTCDLAPVPAGGGARVTIRAQAPLGTSRAFANVAGVTAAQPDPDSENNVSSATVRVGMVDLRVEKIASHAVVAPGQPLTFTVAVSNAGVLPATGVRVFDPLPPNLGLLGVSTTQGGCAPAGGTISCTLGALAPGQAARVFLRAIVSPSVAPGQAVANAAYASADQADADPENNQATAVVDVHAGPADADMAVSKTGAVLEASGAWQYYILITNLGPATASSVLMRDDLPPEALGVFAEISGRGRCFPGARIVTCTTSSLAPGASEYVTITVQERGAVSGPVVNTASVDADQRDLNPDNDESTWVINGADLAIDKSAETRAAPGGGFDVLYTLVVSNAGPARATGVVVRDAPALGVDVFDWGGPPGSDCGLGASPIACFLPPLAPGETAVLNLRGRIGAPGVYPNAAAVAADTFDPDEGNNADTLLTAAGAADLSVSKSGPAATKTGEDITYALGVWNAGPDAATEVVLTDALPAGVEESGVDWAGASCDAGGPTVTCVIDQLAAGSGVTVQLRLRPRDDGALVNRVLVRALTPDPDLENNTDTLLTVAGGADMQALFSAPRAALAALGASQSAVPTPVVVYGFWAHNAGPSQAANVQMLHNLSGGAVVLGHTVSQGACAVAGALVTCGVGTLDAGQSVFGTLTLQATTSGAVLTSLAVTSDSPDPEASDNTATAGSFVFVPFRAYVPTVMRAAQSAW